MVAWKVAEEEVATEVAVKVGEVMARGARGGRWR